MTKNQKKEALRAWRQKEYGGGVCNEDGTFEMSGGEITRNKSEKNGG